MAKYEDVAKMIGERIRTARKALGLTQTELANRMNESTGRIISEWEHARCSPSGPKLLRLTQALGVTPNYLYNLDAEGRGLSLAESHVIEQYRDLDSDGLRAVNAVLGVEHERCTRQIIENAPPQFPTRKIRYIPHSVSAGLGAALQDEQQELIEVPLTRESVRADFVLRVAGNSMEPEFHDGDLLLVQQSATVEPRGEVHVFGRVLGALPPLSA